MMVVVRAEFCAVQRTVANIKMNPKMQERRNWNVNQWSDQPANSKVFRLSTDNDYYFLSP